MAVRKLSERGGRQRQRAYYDALRDLATPAMGHPPLISIDATDNDGAAAYQRHRDRLLAALAQHNRPSPTQSA